MTKALDLAARGMLLLGLSLFSIGVVLTYTGAEGPAALVANVAYFLLVVGLLLSLVGVMFSRSA